MVTLSSCNHDPGKQQLKYLCLGLQCSTEVVVVSHSDLHSADVVEQVRLHLCYACMNKRKKPEVKPQ